MSWNTAHDDFEFACMTHNLMRNLSFDPQPCNLLPNPTSYTASGVLQLARGRIQGCDAIAAQLLGYSVEALLGRRLFDQAWQITHLDGSPLPLDTAINCKYHREIRLGLNRPDGKRLWLHLALTPLFQATTTDTVIATLTPITSPQPLTEQQPQFQHLIQQIAATVPGMLYVYDLIEQRNVYINRQVGEILGYTPEQFEQLGDRVLALLIHPEDSVRLIDHLGRFQTAIDSEVLEFEYRMRRSDGEWCWLLSKETIFSRTDAGAPRQILGVAQEITALKQRETERQQAEASLRESEARFRLMTELLPQIFWTTTIDGSFDYFSPRWEEYVGIDQTLTMGWNWSPVVHPDDLQTTVDRWTEALQTGQFYECEHRLRRYDGEYRWHLSRAMPLRDQAGQIIQWYGTAIDIHDLKQTTAALHQSNAILNTINESTPTLVYVKDRAGRMLVVNPAVLALIGKPAEKIVGKTALEFVEPIDEAEKIMDNDRVVMRTGEPQQFEEIVEVVGGRRVFLSVKAPYRDERGEIIGIIGVSSDITDRKQAELKREQLLALERQYTNQLQGLTAASIAINSAFSVEQVLQTITDQAAAIVGAHQSVTSLTSDQNWAQAITAVYLSEKYAQWRDYHAPSDGAGIYSCVCHNQPMRMTEAELEAHPHWKGFGKEAEHHPPMRGWLAAPLVGHNGQNIGLIQLSDKLDGEFTEADEAILVQLAQLASIAVENARLYEAEQQARSIAEASREEAQAANRIKDEFLAVLSHELRTPLNPILGWIKLLQNGRLDAEKSNAALATIERNARLQSQLVEDLLDISRIMRGKLTLNKSSINLKAIVGAAIETVRLAAEAKSIQLHSILDSNPQGAIGDAVRLQQVVWNLLSNAVKFTPGGGQIWVQLAQVGDHARIQVSDNGKGIDPNFLPYVFDYFRQEDSSTTRKFGGLGLGLAIVRQIVELHGGTVAVDSNGEGRGATFTVRLPLQVKFDSNH
ncbi:PAS domain S-box protein [Leptolyngbya sp. DQ-M1]|uniref:PAS domain S-box protein n=1 Tax=Leptolyngbya sp. DQ-M1 TaxID=2933920 RepID=UPI003297F278